jgi:phosphinothricin acetyltransferase
MPIIRDAGEADLPRILAITNAAIATTTSVWSWTPATLATRQTWMDERRARGFPVLVAEVEGVVQGFASFGAFRAWEGYLHTVEHSLYVDPVAQGRGLGKALLVALEAQARALGMHVMIGGIEGGNIASLALHAGAGFKETGRLKEVGRKFDRWLDLVFMQKVL